jgi:hypothetical protein
MLSPEVVEGSGRIPARTISWPPVQARVGEIVLLGGYPGIYRRENEAEGTFEADFASCGAPVKDVDERKFTVDCPMGSSFGVSEKTMPPNVDLAGVSGGGIYRVIESFIKGILFSRLELTGIIYFGSPGYEVVAGHFLSDMNSKGAFGR